MDNTLQFCSCVNFVHNIKIRITGATGNIGPEVINSPNKIVSNPIIVGVSDLQKAKNMFSYIQNIEYHDFDF